MKTEFVVQNLKCGGCVNTIMKSLNSIEGVSNVSIAEETGRISLDLADKNQLENIFYKLSSLGYPVEGDESGLLTKAKSYVSCAMGRVGNTDNDK